MNLGFNGAGDRKRDYDSKRLYQSLGGINMWVVENINGNGSLVKKEFETYQEAKAYSEWTCGTINYIKSETCKEKKIRV